MQLNYYDLPFGAQLLLWTSRMLINGSCRSFPNKFQLVNIAYTKVGIVHGDSVLKRFLYMIKDKNDFNIQNIANLNLNITEINIINCIEDHKKERFTSNYYLKIWEIHDDQTNFINAAKDLAFLYGKFDLDTNLRSIYSNRATYKEEEFISKTLH
tara:strand:- start:996 stop:1460 length:465 start_codon:yes stop_codon:yes gene_type:complete